MQSEYPQGESKTWGMIALKGEFTLPASCTSYQECGFHLIMIKVNSSQIIMCGKNYLTCSIYICICCNQHFHNFSMTRLSCYQNRRASILNMQEREEPMVYSNHTDRLLDKTLDFKSKLRMDSYRVFITCIYYRCLLGENE